MTPDEISNGVYLIINGSIAAFEESERTKSFLYSFFAYKKDMHFH